MYRLLRNTHLLLGLFLCATILVYGLSSMYMAHRDWLPWQNSTSESRIDLDAGLGDGRAVARALMEKADIWGDLAQVAPTRDGFRLRITRPGETEDAVYRSDNGAVQIKTTRSDFGGMLVALHHARGTNHESLLVNLWGWLVGVASLGLMVLGGTGVYMWFRLHNERVIGGAILALSLAYSLGLIVLMRVA